MEDDMTDESKTVETQDIASPPTEDNQTDTPAEETQAPDETSEEPAEESVESADEEEETVQGQPVPFEEDAAPPAQADEAVEQEVEPAVESETPQSVGCAPHTAPADQMVQDAEQTTEAGAATNPQSEIPNPPSAAPTVESVIEAILFTTDEPLTDSRLASIVETSAKQVRESIDSLNARYTTNNNAFRIEQIAGGYQMLTLNTYNYWLKKMLRARSDNKLSPAAMETLAIIAYKQPVIRADIEAVRGVAAGEVIRSLMYKGLVKIVGRAEILGRPMLYGTTKKFLEVFGLNSLKDLPKAEELKNPDRA
jgi:segregation and condensation protein B